MMAARLGTSRWIQGAVVALALLVLATGLCLFDHDDDGAAGHVTSPDLCLGMLAGGLAAAPLVALLAVGWALNLTVAAPLTVALHTPDPPPRRPRSFRR
jgi:hypothetical protein